MLLEIAIKAGIALVLIAVAILALNWARHPGRRKGGKHTGKHPDPDTPEALQKSLGTMDRILIILGIFLFVFVVAMIALFCIFQQTPDVLIGAVFAAVIGEGSAMAAIKRNKDRLRKELREAQGKDPPDESEEETP